MPRTFNYCPYCGLEGIAFDRIKEFHCPSCKFTYFHNVAAAAGTILECGGKIVLVKRKQEPGRGLLDLPGGFVDPGESAEDALRREIMEELGLEMVSARFLCSHPNTYEYMGVRYATMDLGFVCDIADLKAPVSFSSEVRQVVFVPVAEIDLSQFGFPSAARIVERYRAVCS